MGHRLTVNEARPRTDRPSTGRGGFDGGRYNSVLGPWPMDAEIVFQKKRERRRQLAKLPFEKKIEIVVEL